MADSFEKNSREVGRKALSGIATQTLSQPGRRLRAGVCMYSCECMRANGWHMEEEVDDEAGRKSRAPIFQISRIGAEQPGYPRLLVGGNEHWGLASVVIALIFTPDADKTRQCMYGRFPLFFHRHLPNPGEDDDDDDYEDEINSLLHPHGRRRFENAVKATKRPSKKRIKVQVLNLRARRTPRMMIMILAVSRSCRRQEQRCICPLQLRKNQRVAMFAEPPPAPGKKKNRIRNLSIHDGQYRGTQEGYWRWKLRAEISYAGNIGSDIISTRI
ncbi:predicted protein [Histoplasma capsulatum G186AR]|uniref:Uncharacterized protein n=1 Tax=Ajellomyces capsulatus (strain G186AR / H82 / ATCC MYA-2454 / RMSCC 2432) TaxID=447093 RepID=C0P0P2_AJECG|nr:uncharacterized protein HCBG_08972 [Histoplasma capsulatum G186AR]EEH02862.1 predicted protein [Histoplasma capsulatum G186AR]